MIFGEHAVLLEASMLLPCAVPQQREVGGPAQVSLAAGRQELEGVIVRDEWVLEKRVSRKSFLSNSFIHGIDHIT